MQTEIITSDLLAPVRHGFFTRRGGVSTGILAGLNCGYGSDDLPDNVRRNRAHVAQEMGVGPLELIGAHQTHSTTVASLGPGQIPQDLNADAIATNRTDIAISILTADCQPVLFADADAGVVAAAHAGWKGAMDGILANTIDAMIDLGATRANISAVIGPCISQLAYEVGPEYMEQFLDTDPAFSQFFANGTGDRYQFDLPAFGLHQLRSAGIKSAEWTRHCTYHEPNRFFSFRRSVHNKETDYGRLISTIGL